MKNTFEKIKTAAAAIFFTVAVIAVASFFNTACNNSLTETSIAALQAPAPVPFLNGRTLRSSSPTFNSNRNERSPNSYFSRITGALNETPLTEIITFFHTQTSTEHISYFQKLLKISIPARAGPLHGISIA